MSIETKDYGEVVAITVKGNLMGGAETVAVHDKVKSLIKEDVKKIVVDLSKVKWMNSSGLGTIMGCLSSLKTAEGELKLAGVTEKVKSLFIITKLITLFDSYDSIEEAVAAFE